MVRKISALLIALSVTVPLGAQAGDRYSDAVRFVGQDGQVRMATGRINQAMPRGTTRQAAVLPRVAAPQAVARAEPRRLRSPAPASTIWPRTCCMPGQPYSSDLGDS